MTPPAHGPPVELGLAVGHGRDVQLYDTITSLAESPKAEGLLYAGTDDGAPPGLRGRRARAGGRSRSASLPGVPASAFVNDVKADLHDADTVYVALDDHKSGDFRPYLLKSTDRGRTLALDRRRPARRGTSCGASCRTT